MSLYSPDAFHAGSHPSPASPDPVIGCVVGCGLLLTAPLAGLLLVFLALLTETVGFNWSSVGYWPLFWIGVALPFTVAGVVWIGLRRRSRERLLAWNAEQQRLKAQAAQQEQRAREEAAQQRDQAEALRLERARARKKEEEAAQQRDQAEALRLERARARKKEEEAAQSSRRPAATNSSGGFDTWHDPAVEPATCDWERRVTAFASKSARTLANAGVPLFRSQWSRGARGTYKDAFWLLAVDVRGATRSYVRMQLSTGREIPGDPPQPKKGDFVGHLHGTALLLTRSGIICSADYEGFLTRFGGVDNQCMDMIFKDVTWDSYVLSGADGWGWYNQGRWRRDQSLDLRAWGVDLHTNSMRFEERWRRTEEREPGYGTTAALSSFVKSNGETRWPRYFTSFG